MNKPFLTAQWKNLVMANYAIDASILKPCLPAGTELDTFNNECLVSLVGFEFNQVKIKGVSIPFHTNFPEVNLRFYVKHLIGGEYRRGVVFISEIVPKPAIAWVAKTLFKEKYQAMPMKKATALEPPHLSVEYNWQFKKEWNAISVKALSQSRPMEPGSAESFIFEHYYGYSAINKQSSYEYSVAHPSWNVHPVLRYAVFCDFEKLYGKEFSFLSKQEPVHVFLADGSEVAVGDKRKILF